MSRKEKKKVVIATEEETAEYGGSPPSDQAPATESAAEPAESAEEGADQAGQPDTLEQARAEAEEWRDKCLRAKAELVNFQRRAARERDESVRYAVVPFLRSLLPVLDDLERVIASGRAHPDNAQAILEGVQLTFENFQKVLRDAHVVAIEAEGMPFDPHVHEAMMEQPSEAHAERVVLQELQKGYLLHDRVLRPAKVIVSRPTGQAAEEAEGDEAESDE